MSISWGNVAQNAVSGLASGLMAEANRSGEGAGLAAGFAGAAAPVIAGQRNRIKNAMLDEDSQAKIQRERAESEADSIDFAGMGEDAKPIAESVDLNFDLGIPGVIGDLVGFLRSAANSPQNTANRPKNEAMNTPNYSGTPT